VAQAPSPVSSCSSNTGDGACATKSSCPRTEPFVAVVWRVIYSVSGGIFIADCGCRSFPVLNDGALCGTVDAHDQRAESIREPTTCSPPSGAGRGALNEGMRREECRRRVFPRLAAWEQSETRCFGRYGWARGPASEDQRGICGYSRAGIVWIHG
jgi:hypothetical protein